jgi:DNA-binding transcriptional LysR family regulator
MFLRCSKERLPHGDASDPLFFDRSEDLELHPSGRDLSCSTTVFEPGDQEARGGIGGRAVPQRALQYPPHRSWPQGGTLLTRCYESAVAARDLAGAIKKGVQAPLRLALSHSISLELFVPPLTELVRAFPGLELKFLRGNASEIVRALKAGDTELAIAGPLGDDWERFDSWSLYEEEFRLVLTRDHPLARSTRVSIGDLAGQRLIARGHCESGVAIAKRLAEVSVLVNSAGNVASDQDMLALINANLAVGILPQTARVGDRLMAIALSDLSITRTVTLYTVAGRERAPAASGLIRLLRAYDYLHALARDERALARA